jgi:hypothetical protein
MPRWQKAPQSFRANRHSPELGRRLYVEMSFAIFKGDERKVLGAVGVGRDVTERVERQRAAG